MKYCVGREGRDSRGNICFRNIKWTQKYISTGELPCYTDEEFENQSRVESHLGYVRLFLSLVVMLRMDEQHSHPWSWGSLAAGEVEHSQQAEPEEEVMWEDSCSTHFCFLKRFETAWKRTCTPESIRIVESKRKQSRKPTIHTEDTFVSELSGNHNRKGNMF